MSSKVYYNKNTGAGRRQDRIWELTKLIVSNPNASSLLPADVVRVASMIEAEFSKETEEYV